MLVGRTAVARRARNMQIEAMYLRAFNLTVITIGVLAACGSPTNPDKPCLYAPTVDAIVSATKANTFDPSPVTIVHGHGVCWQNKATVLHTVTADSGAFDTNMYPGKTFEYPFPKAGTYAYHCKIHQGMIGTVIVH